MAPGSPVINAYGGGGFRIAGERHEGSQIIFADQVVPWLADALDASAEGALLQALDDASAVELLLIGCGPAATLLSGDLRAALSARGIGVDGMDTGAACRTFNVLLQEGRQAAAALIAVG
ncbi:MAG: Mth938-like domain-containing protein [Alphaproteobacteria bacterium]|nr:Mth938-like domain-containing protein [Alphaproteobacteria bacterium]